MVMLPMVMLMLLAVTLFSDGSLTRLATLRLGTSLTTDVLTARMGRTGPELDQIWEQELDL